MWAACRRAGFRLTPINWHLTVDEMSYIVERLRGARTRRGPRCRFRGGVGCPPSRHAGRGTDDRRHVARRRGLRRRPRRAAVRPARRPHPRKPDALHVGDDGSRRRACASNHTHRPSTTSRATRADSVHLCTGPLYHAAPLNISLISPLSNGAGVVLMDGWTAIETLRLVEAAPRDAHPHGADDVPPSARARRRDAQPVRRVVVAARGARRRTVPDPGEAGHDRVARAGARRVLRVDRRRGNARRRRHLAPKARDGRASRTPPT